MSAGRGPEGRGEIVLVGHRLSPVDVVEVARRGASVSLGAAAVERLHRERGVVSSALLAGTSIYGLTTGLGPRATHELDAEEILQSSARTVRGRAAAVGAPLETEIVRAVLVARLNAMARGGSGVQPAIADLLVEMLNRGVHPRVPRIGSIGASDLCQLAHVGLVVMGEGSAEHHGRICSGAEALGSAGLAPVTLAPKDGLALCSANSVTAGTAALALADTEDLYVLLHAVVATSFEGFRANTSPLDPRVQAARPAPGQAGSADLLRRLLGGGLLLERGTERRLQDPISFRCAAQVHGSLRSAIDFALPALCAELNGAADNPLVLADEDGSGELLSTGNFHTPALALSLDTVALGLAQSAALCLARVERLLSSRVSGLPANLAPAGAGRSGFAAVVKTGHALLAQIRHLAGPTSIDPRSGAEDVEDDSTNAALGAQRVAAIVERVRLVMAVEALVASRAVELADPGRVGVGAMLVLRAVRSAVAPLDDDRPCGPDIEAVAGEVLTGRLAHRVLELVS